MRFISETSTRAAVAHADVDVTHPYPFTIKSLLVRHLDYRYMRGPVIDTPGILGPPTKNLNTMEMAGSTNKVEYMCAVFRGRVPMRDSQLSRRWLGELNNEIKWFLYDTDSKCSVSIYYNTYMCA
ncbi:hypothetical protein EVJ58_g9093 [Rhodofomes roseus]|uniref:Uncharacterized protein n=1 Tax=Rhodofomes roseus TaxID=34475 RepID=A0A4Y9XZJ8_9APHY|nr:hypothetical protein EVJ58_g9093 [Rhodofomes roseus]